jgi:hypothetical protein
MLANFLCLCGFFRRLSLALSKGHVPGDAEQQDAAGNPQRIQGNTQVIQQWATCRREEHQGRSGDQDRLSCDPAGVFVRMISHQGNEHRREPRWIHDHQEGQQRGNGKLEHSGGTVTE